MGTCVWPSRVRLPSMVSDQSPMFVEVRRGGSGGRGFGGKEEVKGRGRSVGRVDKRGDGGGVVVTDETLFSVIPVLMTRVENLTDEWYRHFL